jgi:hypothetical protein
LLTDALSHFPIFFSAKENDQGLKLQVSKCGSLLACSSLADKIASIQMWKACDFFSAKQNCEFLNAEVLLSLVPPTQQKRQQ